VRPRIYSVVIFTIFPEGVLVAKKDFNAPKHEDLDVPNLEVIKALQSLTSKGYVKTRFSWQWYYYVLTPEGVEYLREWCVQLPFFTTELYVLIYLR
jgi:small subunit ribosomal protein S10e